MEQLLEGFYRQELHVSGYVERKQQLRPGEHTQITGITLSGKTKLIKHYLLGHRKASYLYIDCDDLRIEPDAFNTALRAFCREHEIAVVAFDNYRPDFALPDVSQLLLASEEPSEHPGFRILRLRPLDFEEFLAFEHKYDESALNHYLQLGGMPGMHKTPSESRVRLLQSALQLTLNPLELDLMRYAARLHTQKLSAFTLYERLKQQRRISKDMLYKSFEALQRRGYLHALPKVGHPRAVRKLYLCDIVFKNALSTQKHFGRLFENLVFNELDKHHGSLFYDEGIDFYLPEKNRVILCMPFGNRDMLFKRIEAVEAFVVTHGVTRVEVVTMSSEAGLAHPFVRVEMLPFTQWALSENE